MSEPYLGQIMMVGWNFASRGFALCHGQLIPIAQNTALFSLLGTTFGGDGRTTMGLPDMRGRVPMGQGNGPGLSPRTWGERVGAEQTTITIQNMPSHDHVATTTIHADEEAGNTGEPEDGVLAGSTSNMYRPAIAEPVTLGSASATTTVGRTGGGFPVNNMQPSLCIYFQIAMQGVYPSRS